MALNLPKRKDFDAKIKELIKKEKNIDEKIKANNKKIWKVKKKAKITIENKIEEKDEKQEIEKKKIKIRIKRKKNLKLFDNNYPNTYKQENNDNHTNHKGIGEKGDYKNGNFLLKVMIRRKGIKIRMVNILYIKLLSLNNNIIGF